MSERATNDKIPLAEIVTHYRPVEALIPSHWRQGDVVANGIRQHYYRTGGDRPRLVLLHGLMEGALSWLRTAAALEADYDIIMLDARGHGRSDGIASGYTGAQRTADVAGAMRALDLGAACVLGFSQGAGTGISLADEHPDLVRALIAEGMPDAGAARDLSGTDFTKSPGYMAWYNSYVAWLEQLKTQTHEQRMLSALSFEMPGAPLAGEMDYVASVENAARLDPNLVHFSLSLWSAVPDGLHTMEQALQRLTCPVLVMQSSSFPTPGPFSLEEKPSNQPNVRIIRFANTGHLIHRERFEAFIDEVKRFLPKD